MMFINNGKWDFDEIKDRQGILFDDVVAILTSGYMEPEEGKELKAKTSVERIAKKLNESNSYVVFYDFVDKKGEKLRKQVIFDWLDEEKNEILLIQMDVSQAYRKEQELLREAHRAKQEADDANKAKSEFLSHMSHDLRTPLNGIIGFTEYALKESDADKKQSYMEKVEASGKLMLDMINDTLELSRIESGKETLDKQAVTARELVASVVTSLSPEAELKNIELKTRYEVDMDSLVFADKTKTQKIVLNLVSNAIKYTHENGTVYVSVLPVNKQDNGGCSWEITVEDNGIGISEEFCSMMFEPFSQEKRSDISTMAGTGLGLSIVKKYVDMMQGTIEVKSKVHEGTKITVCLPIEKADGTATQEYDGGRTYESLKGRRILIFEDNLINAEIAELLLKDAGVRTDHAVNGREGLKIFEASKAGYYDAILMDIRMPVMNGYEATEAIRALNRSDALSIPIIALTAEAFKETVDYAESLGMNGYIIKPVDSDAMLRTIAEKIK